MLFKTFPDFLFDLQGTVEAFEEIKCMGLSGEEPLGDVKTKAHIPDYHKNEPPAAARQAEVAQDYLKRAAGIGEFNGHSSGSDGPLATALKRYNGGRALQFVMGAFAELPGDMTRICDITAHELARTHVLNYNRDTKRTKGMYRQRTQKATSKETAARTDADAKIKKAFRAAETPEEITVACARLRVRSELRPLGSLSHPRKPRRRTTWRRALRRTCHRRSCRT